MLHEIIHGVIVLIPPNSITQNTEIQVGHSPATLPSKPFLRPKWCKQDPSRGNEMPKYLVVTCLKSPLWKRSVLAEVCFHTISRENSGYRCYNMLDPGADMKGGHAPPPNLTWGQNCGSPPNNFGTKRRKGHFCGAEGAAEKIFPKCGQFRPSNFFEDGVSPLQLFRPCPPLVRSIRLSINISTISFKIIM